MRAFGITKRFVKRGFTLIELMIVVVIIGILAALAIYGVSRYVTNAKTAEARNSLGRLGKDAAAAYQREGMPGDVLALEGVAGASRRLCASAATKVPDTEAKIKGQKYQSTPAEWNAGADSNTGFKCLKFSMDSPQYYMYGYTASGTSGTAGETFTASAEGDLNGDGVTSVFSIAGKLQAGSSGGLILTVAPNIEEVNPEE